MGRVYAENRSKTQKLLRVKGLRSQTVVKKLYTELHVTILIKFKYIFLNFQSFPSQHQ